MMVFPQIVVLPDRRAEREPEEISADVSNST